MKGLNPKDPIVQTIINDNRPIALRKKRRRSIASSPQKYYVDCDGSSESPPPQTPAKIKKRVRFSDPGPKIPSEDSTGITPFVQKTSLQPREAHTPTARRPLQKALRRMSSLPSFSTSSNQGPFSELSSPVEMQFAPLREVLTPRTRRQLGRNRLSEEMNSIESERKTLFKQKQEINELKQELEETRQRNILIDGPDDNDMQQPNEMMRHPKSEIQDIPLRSIDSSYGSDEDDAVGLVDADVYEDPEGVLIDATQDQQSTIPLSQPLPQTANASNQTEIVESSMITLETHIETQTANLLQARLDLERLYPGETPLPLGPPADGDCSPLLSVMLEHLRTAQCTLQSTRSALKASETQESNVRMQFNGVLTNLDATREAHAQLLKGAKAGAEKYAQARERISALETELDESNRSSEKLKTALNSYREEVKSLESLVTRVEEEGKQKLESLRSEMSETATDLECMVAAETHGRREAEDLIDMHVIQMKTLEGHKQELREALSEKQALVRNLEEELAELKRSKEDETGRLNVKVGYLEEALLGAQTELKKLEKKNASLSKAVVSGKEREMKSVANLKAELRKAVRGVEGVVGGWEREASRKGEGIEVGGLLTPRVEGGRFRDVAMDTVEGAVEMKRGKSRRSRGIDSGIGMFGEVVYGEER